MKQSETNGFIIPQTINQSMNFYTSLLGLWIKNLRVYLSLILCHLIYKQLKPYRGFHGLVSSDLNPINGLIKLIADSSRESAISLIRFLDVHLYATNYNASSLYQQAR